MDKFCNLKLLYKYFVLFKSTILVNLVAIKSNHCYSYPAQNIR